MSAPSSERLLERIRAEFLEMPGLRLHRHQVQRLCGVDVALIQPVLDSLVAGKFLCVKADGAYARLTEGQYSRPQPAKADLRPARDTARAS